MDFVINFSDKVLNSRLPIVCFFPLNWIFYSLL